MNIKNKLFLSNFSGLKIAVFIAFFIYLFMQHSMVYYYNDDWGLSVLNYITSVQTGFEGQDYSLIHLFNFLRGYYLKWSGRIGGVLSLILAQKVGLQFVQLFQSIIIVLVVLGSLLISRKIAEKETGRFDLLLSVLLFAALPATVLVNGLYWYCASTMYLWGLPFYFGAIFLLLSKGELTLPGAILMMVAVTFHELLGIAILGFLLTLFLFDLISEKKFLSKNFFYSIIIYSVALFVILAPGNFRRKNMSLEFYNSNSFSQIIYSNVESISNLLFDLRPDIYGSFNIFFLCMVLSAFFLLFKLYKENKNQKTSVVFLVLLIPLYFLDNKIPFAILFTITYLVLLYMSGQSHRLGRFIFAIQIGAVLSLFPLFYIPGIEGRTLITFHFLEFIPIIFSALIVKEFIPKYLKIFIILFVFILSFGNASLIYKGYLKNDKIHQFNDHQLRLLSVKQEFKNQNSYKVTLVKLKDPRFAEMMPYQNPKLLDRWVKQYYNLADKTEFNWVSPDSFQE